MERRRGVALAGHIGDFDTARRATIDPAPAVRSTALGALARLERLDRSTWEAGLEDTAPEVRRRACELGVGIGPSAVELLTGRLVDGDAGVAEAASFALGELAGAARTAVPALATVAGTHHDPLVREAAVAALGAIGAPEGLDAILAATTDKPAVRRRAVLALAPFEGAEVDAALARALQDRDWQVRQAAEDLSGGPPAT